MTSNDLILFLCDEIERAHGHISFARFMELALYHPTLGYYNQAQFAIGRSGDFITAPEISPLFARCIAAQCVEIFENLPQKNLLEFGAGTGVLAKNLIQAFRDLNVTLWHYYIVEISPTLRKKQQEMLKIACPWFYERIIWLDTPPDNFEGVMIANEVLDALPVHCFRIDKSIQERSVTFINNQFTWKLTEPSEELLKAIHHLQAECPLPEEYESEVNLAIQPFLENSLRALKKGLFLIFDYGYGQYEYYHPQRNRGTLTCFYQHHYHDNPFFLPGFQDITAHVDFTRVAEIALANHADILGFTTQSAFLLGLGLIDLAGKIEENLNPVEAFELHQAIKTLTLPTEMGERIKVLAIGKEIEVAPKGFQLQDRRRTL